MSPPGVAAPGRLDCLPRAVLFDWDNTLATNWRCVHAALNVALTSFGLAPWTLEETYQQVRYSMRDSFPVLFGDDWQRAREIFYDHFRRHHLDELEPLDGAAELLELLAGLGIYLGIVSNKSGPLLRAEADKLGWSGYFGGIVGATDAPADKPAVEPVHMALAGVSLAPGDRVWFVGDTDVDMECAHQSGCVPILVGQTPGLGGGLLRYPPVATFDGCADLGGLVRRLADTISLGVGNAGR